ncbi:DUF1488 domain-containing protein [Mesorhizobium sp.]|uniref:DUF1488 domain-containing protein n=1 Tax=Mesorhizobium sp. TaxID=1871066 RepID=UPI000FE3CE62|nr:DUF1488 domain-containing protein [Mesorhizobium sp.]RWH73434.1 MAG: DUF1488 domain-containing protein [Mesorhizobium sp.]RWL25653.1 MAG: DUF1488 domain-containing protein [Mesorhizobium sp.]RWL36500.1 MAG: DUF1488 domain-containing protein [Mesorhizobium sp.]RWL40740.1 MAG: DUF1488 domain-containing protein [Mesorhizobium sp.]RWL54449.1 MAG: DUF1488 domain-containing protein [Mesorhizobium sp.]
MTLAFPNPSRSFDETRNAVRFMGHDGMFQIRFFVEASALTKSDAARREVGALKAKCLSAFDALRTSIYDVARETYSHGRRDSYTLTAADFR